MIGLIKDELGGRIMTEFTYLSPKTCSDLIDHGNTNKKIKSTKKYVIKKGNFKFEDYKHLEATQHENKIKPTRKINLM